MEQTERLYPSAPLDEKINDLEQQIEKKLNNVNSFNNHVKNIEEMITYFKDKNNKSKKNYKNYKTLTILLKSFDIFVITATTPSSITLSLTGFGLTVIPISRSVACGLTISNKL